MSLITPDFGLFFWMVLAFGVVAFVLAKFAWRPILAALHAREGRIAEALGKAEQAQGEIVRLEAQQRQMMSDAQRDRDAVVKEAQALRARILEEASQEAREQASRYMSKAREEMQRTLEDERARLRRESVSLVLTVAERVLRERLADNQEQRAHVERLLKELEVKA